ncbi:MAG: hypothetical protein ACLP5H_08740 [Desulfomonilaceae bacterium]
MKFTDIVKRKGLSGPIQKADRLENPSERRTRDFEILTAPLGGSAKDPENDYQYERPLPVRDQGARDPGYYASPVPDKDFSRFQDRLRAGKVKICDGCGGVMAKSSRMILSPLSGFVVILLGAGLMTLYGLATNFFQTPWFIKFVLPASYYVGSIFLGFGILFFFIREKVWTCHRCKEIRKR